jgi:GntR family transcriptional regulator, rspAB operon transcriptional repressor
MENEEVPLNAEKTARMGSIYEQLRLDIINCVLAPGAQIFEQDLARKFSVSKSPIREALLRLQEQDLVEVRARRGYRVRPISISEAEDMYEMRLLYERAGVARCIEHATDVEIAKLYELCGQPDIMDLPPWIAANRTFHTELASKSGNARLTKVSVEFLQQFDRFTYFSVGRLGRPPLNVKNFVAEHVALVDAIARREKRVAQAIIREHIEASRRRTIEALGELAVVP